MVDFTGGVWRSLVDGEKVSAITDSVVSRPDDDDQQSLSIKIGIQIKSDVEWPQIGGRISANVSNPTRAYIYRVSDEKELVSKDISGLSAGDTFFVDLEPNIQPFDGTTATEYRFLLDANGNTWTAGRLNNTSYPYVSSDGNLEITSGAKLSQTSAAAYSLVEVGDV
jgi:hypothetical protein